MNAPININWYLIKYLRTAYEDKFIINRRKIELLNTANTHFGILSLESYDWRLYVNDRITTSFIENVPKEVVLLFRVIVISYFFK